jgi:ABC-type dipeptide/oligopeptide/nickel transport system ATPase component
MSRLIDVENLTLQFDTDEGRITAVDNVSFSLEAGEVMGLVGESGSGKSVTAKSLMKLNPGNAVYGPDTKITLHLEDGPVDVMALQNERRTPCHSGLALRGITCGLWTLIMAKSWSQKSAKSVGRLLMST